jgi:transposase InsO family protein
MDIFTRSIRGWELAGNMLEDLPKAALQRALEHHRPEIHHSDQGVQYAANGYVALLQTAQAQISMAAEADTDRECVCRAADAHPQGRGGLAARV